MNNEGYQASLEKGQLDHILPDEKAAEHGYMRVIDEIMVIPPRGLFQLR